MRLVKFEVALAGLRARAMFRPSRNTPPAAPPEPPVSRRRQGRCSGCDRPLDTKTPGCKTCVNRHSMRKAARRARPDAVLEEMPLVKLGRGGKCRGCGGPHDGYTRGCKPCRNRHSHRRCARQ